MLNEPPVAPRVTCLGETFNLYMEPAVIQARVAELGRQISEDYAGKVPILIGVLNGAFVFFADLIRHITIDCEVDFLKLSSYGDAKVSSGNVSELKRVDAQLEGRHVIIVEDIVDTGLSMEFMLERLAESNPASIRVAVLLHKHEATRVPLALDYVAFPIPNLFVIGYGLDYGQFGRNLPGLYLIEGDDENEA